MKFQIQPASIPVSLTPEILADEGKTQRRVKSAFTLAKKSWVDSVHHTKYCAWCGGPNTTVLLSLKFDGLNVTVLNGGYKKDLFCCFSKGCAHKRLNPNSLEFVMKANGMSAEEASKLIRRRNKTPFYAVNHKTGNEYSKYQGSRCYGVDKERNKQIIAKQNHTRSLAGYVERYGVEGEARWLAVQKSKSITLENLPARYGENAVTKLNNWKNSVSCSLENFIRRHGEENGKRLYRHAVATHGFYSPVTFTAQGSSLRSNLERNFFNALINAKLTENDDFFIDRCYPNSGYRYDFFFPALNLYVEICGGNSKEYRDKMKLKEKLFGARLVYPKQVESAAKEITECLNLLKLQT